MNKYRAIMDLYGVKDAFIPHQLRKGIWPWVDGVRSRFPDHYKTRFLEKYTRQALPVHERPDTRKYNVDEFGVRTRVVNVPMPIVYPSLCNEGLWGGEGVIEGWKMGKRKKSLPHPKVWFPGVHVRVFRSEILDQWLGITVTHRAMQLIDAAYGLDHYILKTHEVDMKSKLGMRLKRAMLLVLADKSFYPNDPVKRDEIYQEYKQYEIPREEAEWIGLNLSEAEQKQNLLDEEEQLRNTKPLREMFLRELLAEIKEPGTAESSVTQPRSWKSAINPFKSSESKAQS